MSISLPIIVDHSCYTLHLPTPNVPDINEVVSPPSAPLPAWDGKLKWQARRANAVPPQPCDRKIWRRKGIKHIKEGAVFPETRVERFPLRYWPFSDKTTEREEAMDWGLLV